MNVVVAKNIKSNLKYLNPYKIANYLYREIKTYRWKAAAKLHRSLNRGIVSNVGSIVNGCVLWPSSKKRIYFGNVRKGTYCFEIRHADQKLAGSRKALVARFQMFNGTPSREVAGRLGMMIGDDDSLLSYFGGGKPRDYGVAQNAVINVEKDQRWLKVTLSSTLDRVINLDQLCFRRLEEDNSWIEAATAKWAENLADATDIKYLLYADINLNIVDGSSVWLSSMASILCGYGRCILVSKSDIHSDVVVSNIQNRENLLIISPDDLNSPRESFTPADACRVLRSIDGILPRISHVVIRGVEAAEQLLVTRQFRERALVYLTDFYVINEDGLEVPAERAHSASICTNQAAKLIVQTPAIEQKLRQVTGLDFEAFELPPPIPDELPQPKSAEVGQNGPLLIGYSGKITPDWGVEELLDWIAEIKERGVDVEVHIVANKISEGSGAKRQEGFRTTIMEKMQRVEAKHYQDFNRQQSMRLMSEMDYVWCWRPARLENNTLELSTKLVEMIASGSKCICYPSEVNVSVLGADYPFFADNLEDFGKILASQNSLPSGVANALRQKHSLATARRRFFDEIIDRKELADVKRICVASHDFKFIDPYVSYLKSVGHEVVRDTWAWGDPVNVERSKACQDWAHIVLCEWGLANAVWHSNNLAPGKRLFIRAHAQEVNPRASKFGRQINIDNVEKVIFVSRRVRDRALELFGWPKEKTVIIPNYLLEDEYKLASRKQTETIRLGMVGMIPQSKRLDRAIDTLLVLRQRGRDAELFIKGPRPETLEFMHGPSRKAELDYYREIYARIDGESLLAGRVHFDPWGNDVALWYRKVDHIISCSDHESFHYALADGVLTGCQPLLWPWEEAASVYSSDWIVNDPKQAADRIEVFRNLSEGERRAQIEANRNLLVGKYGHESIYGRLAEVLNIEGRV